MAPKDSTFELSTHLSSSPHGYDGPMAWSYIQGWIGKYFESWTISNQDAKELSENNIRLMIDVLANSPSLFHKYAWSGRSEELELLIQNLHSGRQIFDEKSIVQPVEFKTISTDEKSWFEEYCIEHAKKDTPSSKKLYDSRLQHCKEQIKYYQTYDLSRSWKEKLTKWKEYSQDLNIRAYVLKDTVKSKKSAYKKKYIDLLNQLLLNDSISKAQWLWEYYNSRELLQIESINKRITELFNNYMLEDYTNIINPDLRVQQSNDEFEEIDTVSYNISKPTYNFLDSQYKLQKILNGKANNHEFQFNMIDHCYNLIAELCVCEYLQKIVEQEFPNKTISVYKPWAIDDIMGGVDFVVDLQHSDGNIDRILFDLKTTNSKSTIDAVTAKTKPLWNLSWYTHTQQWLSWDPIIVGNSSNIIAIDPSLVHYLVGVKLSLNPSLGNKDSILDQIFEDLNTAWVNNSIVKSYTEISPHIKKQLHSMLNSKAA